MIKPTVKTKKKEDSRLKSNLYKFDKGAEKAPTVVAGFPKSKVGNKMDGGIPVGAVAALMEFGTKNIPARPFMQVAFITNAAKYKRLTRKIAEAAANGKDLTKAVKVLGEAQVKDIKSSITDFDGEALKPSTIKRKGHDKPLIDSGTMYDSVTYDVVPGRKGKPKR